MFRYRFITSPGLFAPIRRAMLGAVALIMLAAAISCGSAGDAESTATSEPITAPEPANTPEAVSTPVAVTPTETVQTPLLKGMGRLD
ncbi:MAG: hypothetical protein HOF43_06445 [Chloroflexi bacterium]|nr:hypothetical protein [Chloroflexota bacterium]